jgi:hypothetical protein
MLTEEEALQRFLRRLPAEARAAIHTLEIAGTPQIEAAVHRVERTLVDAACNVSDLSGKSSDVPRHSG